MKLRKVIFITPNLNKLTLDCSLPNTKSVQLKINILLDSKYEYYASQNSNKQQRYIKCREYHHSKNK